MHDVTNNKTCSIMQVTQKPFKSVVIFSTIRFVTRNRFSKATNIERFLAEFSQKYVLQMYKNVMKVMRPQ